MTPREVTSNDELARLVESASTHGDVRHAEEIATIDLVLMEAGRRWFGVHAGNVREVIPREEIARIPNAPRHVIGLAMVHGRLVPAVSLDAMIGASSNGAASTRRIAVIVDGDREIGVLADRVRGIISLPANERAMAPDRATWIVRELDWGGEPVGLIDPVRLIDFATDGSDS